MSSRLVRSLVVVLSAVACGAGSSLSQIRDIDGRWLSLWRPQGAAQVIVFVASDCPVSNGYAPEIQRICNDYRSRGVSCALLYEDPRVSVAAVRQHLGEYGYRGVPAAIDDGHRVARDAKASVTPEAVVIDAKGAVRYRGRIDNFYAALGKPRQVVTSHDVRDALDAVLAGRPVPHPETTAIGCFIGAFP